ncbi:MAG: tRNA dihydrouridine(20/20a) synthase DusA [Wenzhouxiangella sp.]|nr:tRNA dihydrouridine(20/20a) synthase DusA [Wenzhouxiangella sp.]MCH8477531.1 tRNA dihydrouridine(20/20a) synthase DusA [Wenzhouxiangella sp.]TVR98288.1 MAG: tRNA dihydrouridine(20/20a) synthase DusA [Wenzhouxiangellaceae bacterium]
MDGKTHLLCVAPMMDWTDRHCRFFHRQINADARLYTEMVTTGAVIHGDRERLLGFAAAERPLALQLGGSEPEALAKAAVLGAERGYDEINLNVGCPSDRVQKGRFGACLMKEPALVAECLAAMRAAVAVPVTVKSRIGVDELDSEEFLIDFVERVAESGTTVFIIHARKAWLSGLSPKENREVPPLHYDRVHRLVERFPGLEFVLNGGIVEVGQARQELSAVHGVMLGRSAYQNPWILAELGAVLGQPVAGSRRQVVESMVEYADAHLQSGGRLQQIARHMLGLFHGQPGARGWRQTLSQNMHKDSAGPELLLEAMP